MPKFSEDDVTDYMVREAILMRVRHEQKETEKQRRRDEWRGGEAEGHKAWAKKMGLV